MARLKNFAVLVATVAALAAAPHAKALRYSYFNSCLRLLHMGARASFGIENPGQNKPMRPRILTAALSKRFSPHKRNLLH
ncbi:MAG: hypothetical protein FD135_3546 [Comamonadaceae bacterium]|nr:MAG: hypothetical protein FD135_3546 [Comamonadaceae bacterium]